MYINIPTLSRNNKLVVYIRFVSCYRFSGETQSYILLIKHHNKGILYWTSFLIWQHHFKITPTRSHSQDSQTQRPCISEVSKMKPRHGMNTTSPELGPHAVHRLVVEPPPLINIFVISCHWGHHPMSMFENKQSCLQNPFVMGFDHSQCGGTAW